MSKQNKARRPVVAAVILATSLTLGCLAAIILLALGATAIAAACAGGAVVPVGGKYLLALADAAGLTR